MQIFDRPLTSEESADHIENGRLVATLKIPFSDIVDANGIDGMNDLVDDFFPDHVLSDMNYDVVGFEPPPKNDADCCRGFILVKVDAEVDEF